MTANSITREGGDEVGPLIYVCHPSRGLAYVGAGLLVFAVAFLTLAYLEIGPFTLDLPIILAVILVPVGVAFLTQLLKTPYKVGQQGFAVYKKGEWRLYPWQDLTAIWLTTTHTYHEVTQSVAQDHSCKVMFKDGLRLKLEHLSQEFLSWMEQEAYRSILPKVQAQWDSGQPIRFGAVSLSKTGIHAGRHLLRWADVASVNPERNESNIVIRERGRDLRWKELDGVGIPNFALFSQLVQESLAAEHD
jgi:hypothetical protein